LLLCNPKLGIMTPRQRFWNNYVVALDGQNEPDPESRVDRCHCTKQTHSVTPNRTRRPGKGDFLTDERTAISDKAFPIEQFLGDIRLRHGATSRIDLGRPNQCQQGSDGSQASRRPRPVFGMSHFCHGRPGRLAFCWQYVATVSVLPQRTPCPRRNSPRGYCPERANGPENPLCVSAPERSAQLPELS